MKILFSLTFACVLLSSCQYYNQAQYASRSAEGRMLRDAYSGSGSSYDGDRVLEYLRRDNMTGEELRRFAERPDWQRDDVMDWLQRSRARDRLREEENRRSWRGFIASAKSDAISQEQAYTEMGRYLGRAYGIRASAAAKLFVAVRAGSAGQFSFLRSLGLDSSFFACRQRALKAKVDETPCYRQIAEKLGTSPRRTRQLVNRLAVSAPR